MNKISAVIITYNEEANIGRCLQSLQGVVDEILVVDAFSADRTVEICREFQAQVVQKSWEGYSRNKNFGNAQARFDYILSIDADEALSPELAHSILAAKSNLRGAYTMSRLTNYCGRWIRHGGWYPDVKLRLFNRQDARWVGDFVHESLEFVRRVPRIHLKGDLLHYSFHSLADHLQRVNTYSDLAAREILHRNPTGILFKMLFSPPAKFIKGYVFQRGFLDGFHGLCIAAISAFDVFIRYAKVHELRQARKAEEKPSVSE